MNFIGRMGFTFYYKYVLVINYFYEEHLQMQQWIFIIRLLSVAETVEYLYIPIRNTISIGFVFFLKWL